MTNPRPLTDAEIVALYLARDESAVEHTALMEAMADMGYTITETKASE